MKTQTPQTPDQVLQKIFLSIKRDLAEICYKSLQRKELSQRAYFRMLAHLEIYFGDRINKIIEGQKCQTQD